ncbi:uncharacterized protein LOC142166805 [Nicotiana tabacum]|uniref:Uncharacterized protein LOC142166805 n=1 Tax=Nicotiana tabacum TaxID=4097 RepID=A0AC58SBF1_TOBAC
MRSLWDELNSSYAGHVCSCGALPKFIEDQQLFQFLNGINESYTTVKSVIMLMNPLPPISKAYSPLQQDESQREAYSAAPNFSGDATSLWVFPDTSTTNRNFSQKVNFETRKTTPNVSCKYCKKPGHSVDKCYILHGFPADFKFTRIKKYASCVQTESPPSFAVTSTSQHTNTSTPGFTKEQYQHLMTLFQQTQMPNTSTPDTSNVDHSAFAHFAGLFSKYAVDSEGSHVCSSSQLGVNPFILDTCATNHITPHKHLLCNVQPLIKPFYVTLPNGYKVKVISIGYLYLRHDIILLHGPSLKRPLEIGKASGRLYDLHPDTDLFPVPSSSMNVSSSSTLPNSVSIVSDKSNHVVTHANGTHACQTMPLLVAVLKPPSYSQAKALLPSVVLKNLSPYKKLHGLPPLYNHLKSFGCLCFATSPKFDRDKFQARAIPSIFLGCLFGKKGYKLLNLTTHSIFFSRDVVFYEHIFPYKSDHPFVFPSYSTSDFVDSATSFSLPSPTPAIYAPQDSLVPSFPSPTPLSFPPPLSKSTRTVQQPSYLKDYVCSSVLSSNSLPNFSKEAMLKEFQALEANQTWDIVPLPPQKKVIPCKWVYKIKQRVDGSIERYKARLKKSLYGIRQASRQWFSKLSEALQPRGYISSINDYSLFTKSFLDAQFKIKDLGSVHYFLGLEISLLSQGYVMRQYKYTSHLLSEFNCQYFSPVMTPLDPSVKLVLDMGEPVSDSSFKKQPTISLSSAEAEYRALRKVSVEVSWLLRLLHDLGLSISNPVSIYCDNQAALHIAKSPYQPVGRHHDQGSSWSGSSWITLQARCILTLKLGGEGVSPATSQAQLTQAQPDKGKQKALL